MNIDISSLRQNYHFDSLNRKQLKDDPIDQFITWFTEAKNSGIPEPNAMILSTVNSKGEPSSRMVLMKDLTNEGVTFFTNYKSNKSSDITNNPNVSLLFSWLPLERQVHIKGGAVKLSSAESDEYFKSRPYGSRLGAWVSEQSKVISGREELELRLEQLKNKWQDGNIPRPEYWGGYLVRPTYFEFWQGRENRLHDRFGYTLSGNYWKIERLSP